MVDILDELKAWRGQLRVTPPSAGVLPRREINTLGRAIREIEKLRGELKNPSPTAGSAVKPVNTRRAPSGRQ